MVFLFLSNKTPDLFCLLPFAFCLLPFSAIDDLTTQIQKLITES
ncbi:hypothetical protein [Moorena sp. SIO4G3]|nr:hypothetical protein [Moorena sp. SIO4G3]